MGKLKQLIVFDSREPMNMGDTIADLDHCTHIDCSYCSAELLDLLLNN